MEKFLYSSNKDINGYKLWMAYPAIKEFALSSLGYMWLSMIADMTEGIHQERVFTDTSFTEINPKELQAIAFSMSFDFDFMGVFEILKRYSIPFESQNRDESKPLLFAGGPVITTNPSLYSKIFDFMIIGDGEVVFKEVLEVLKSGQTKFKTLEILSNIEGVYVPIFKKQVKRRNEKLSDIIYTPIISDKSYFKDTFIIEIARGCMNRCSFCTASYLNLPFRYCDYDKIIETIELGLNHTNKIALLGAQLSAHPRFAEIINFLREKIESGMEIEIGLSSLRADSVTEELIQALVLGGQKTSTIAIESANENLRKFVNKNLKDEQIFNVVKMARENGLKGLKIYSMIGIPNETQNDIEDFIKLGKNLKEENKGFNLTFSFSTFVPKPNTPLQWAKREDSKTLEKKQKYLEKEFAKLGIETKFSSIKWDYWQTVLSRGDESLTPLLIEVFNNGGKLGTYKSAVKNLDIDITKFVNGCNFEEDLPWDFIETYPNKELLINEYNRLIKKFNKN